MVVIASSLRRRTRTSASFSLLRRSLAKVTEFDTNLLFSCNVSILAEEPLKKAFEIKSLAYPAGEYSSSSSRGSAGSSLVSPDHPLLALLEFDLAFVFFRQRKLPESMIFLNSSAESFAFHLGEGHPLSLTAKEIFEDIKNRWAHHQAEQERSTREDLEGLVRKR